MNLLYWFFFICLYLWKFNCHGCIYAVDEIIQFNVILKYKRMLNEWRNSILVSIYKNKGDIQSCQTYRGTKLMRHTKKILERIVEQRLRRTQDLWQRIWFYASRLTMEVIYLLRCQDKKTKEDFHLVVWYLEKAYDWVPVLSGTSTIVYLSNDKFNALFGMVLTTTWEILNMILIAV